MLLGAIVVTVLHREPVYSFELSHHAPESSLDPVPPEFLLTPFWAARLQSPPASWISGWGPVALWPG
jgi:hypothetical protein